MANRDDMLRFAETVAERLGPACLRVEIAGGLRRLKPEPHDIELVVIPVFDRDLLDAETEGTGALDASLAELVREGLLEWDEAVKRRGQKYRRFVVPTLGVPFEIFAAVRENWGNQLALRTGPADWNKVMVMPTQYGGCMPPTMIHAAGFLWRFPSVFEASAARRMKAASGSAFKSALSRAERLDAPTEEAFFAHLRLPWVEPHERTSERAAELAEIAARGERIREASAA
jgi:DNA polymerase/3'-5' exonuclease PolX